MRSFARATVQFSEKFNPFGAVTDTMANAAENGTHKTIALFDVDGTLTVPRKACP